MPRRAQPTAKAVRRVPEPGKQQQTAAILASRQRLMLEVAAAQTSGRSSKFTVNAEELLTRWWARASWNARREILKTADWLLRLEAHRDPSAPASG